MKRIVITKPGCRELANHLWNYISVYAYALETGARVVNPSFSKWHRYFSLGNSFLERFWSLFDTLYGSYVVRAHKECTLLAVNEIVHLPPKKACDMTYCIGWFFRNPRGLERYRKEIVSAFTPKASVVKKIEVVLSPYAGTTLLGIRLREEPFRVSPKRVRTVIDEYLREKGLDAKNVALIVVSDTPVDPTAFTGFTTHISTADEVTNLFLLSRCSVVIGTNSTFSNLSAWFGDAPHLVTTNEPIDWEYYRHKTAYFENKYATFAE